MGGNKQGGSAMPAAPSSRQITRRSVLAGAALAPAFLTSAGAQTPAPIAVPGVTVTGSDTLDIFDLRRDPYGRITTQVMLNGQGPFHFFVDTGANRSALSAATAARIGAIPAGEGLVHGVTGAQVKPMATLQSLRCGVFEQRNTIVPILGDDLILPAAGMLGMDRFSGLRLEFDNGRREMVVKRSGHAWGNALSIPATVRYGQLISARARIGGLHVPMVFDTGAEHALANRALSEAIRTRAQKIAPTRISTATMPILVENLMIIPEIKLENSVITNTAAYVDDFHIFGLWDLIDKPALIVGMQVLRSVKRFAFDYRRQIVQFDT
jgi:predicted aspartyl protease